MRSLFFLFIAIVFQGAVLGTGCVSGGALLDIERGDATGNATEIPSPTDNLQWVGSGSHEAQSVNYQAYQSLNSISAVSASGIARGTQYRIVGSHLGLGQQALLGQEE